MMKQGKRKVRQYMSMLLAGVLLLTLLVGDGTHSFVQAAEDQIVSEDSASDSVTFTEVKEDVSGSVANTAPEETAGDSAADTATGDSTNDSVSFTEAEGNESSSAPESGDGAGAAETDAASQTGSTGAAVAADQTEGSAVERIQKLIDALPDADSITEEKKDEVEKQLDEISSLWAKLSDEETELVNIERYSAAIIAMDTLAGLAAASAPATTAAGAVELNIKDGNIWIEGDHYCQTRESKIDTWKDAGTTSYVITGSSTGPSAYGILGIYGDVTVTLKNLNIVKDRGIAEKEVTPLKIDNATLNLILEGSNNVAAGGSETDMNYGKTAMSINLGSKVTIGGSGSLVVTGGSSARAISGNITGGDGIDVDSGSSLTITDSANVTVHGGNTDAERLAYQFNTSGYGIRTYGNGELVITSGSFYADGRCGIECDNLKISGGIVEAKGLQKGMAGVSTDKMVTTGGSVTAISGPGGCAIVGVYRGNSQLYISGDSTVVTMSSEASSATQNITTEIRPTSGYLGKIAEGSNVTWTVTGTTKTSFAQNTTITFTENNTEYTVTLQETGNGASGSGSYLPGDTVNVKAGTKAGYRFGGWQVVAGNITLSDKSQANTSFSMMPGNVTLKATWLPTYTVSVISGSKNPDQADYVAGDRITLTAQNKEESDRLFFDHWELNGSGTLQNAQSSPTVFVVGNGNAELTAVYKKEMRLTLEGGTGGGVYYSGDKVKISAEAVVENTFFDHWEIRSGDGTIENPNSNETVFVAGNVDTEVVAVYVQGYWLTVEGGTGSGLYHSGTEVPISATPDSQETFAVWSQSGTLGSIAKPYEENTVFTIGEEDVTVTANFEKTEVTVVGDFVVSGGILNTDYTYSGGVLRFNKNASGRYTVSMREGVTRTSNRIIVDNGSPTIVLNGVNIRPSGRQYEAPFQVSGGNPTIVLQGDNKLDGSGEWTTPGIYKTGGTLKITSIQGDGSTAGTLTVTGGGDSAGIGGTYRGNASNITINGGTIIASSAKNGAGIGGGYAHNQSNNGTGTNIVINGGKVTATSSSGAGIGGGYGTTGTCSIVINGGEIIATGGNGVGIGCGGASSVTVNGDAVIMQGDSSADTQVTAEDVKNGTLKYVHITYNNVPVTGLNMDSAPDIVYAGGSHSFTAELTGGSDKTIVWTVSGNTSENTKISAEGQLLVAADEEAKELTITASSQQNPDITASVTVPVKTVELTAEEEMLLPGEDAALTFKVDEDAEGTVQFYLDGKLITGKITPVDGTATCTIDSDLLSEGDHSVTAVFSGDDFRVETEVVTLTIKGKSVEITEWPEASSITYGQSLADSELIGGTAIDGDTGEELTGTFQWADDTLQPSAGDTQECDVIFVADEVIYERVTGQVSVKVEPATPEISWAEEQSERTVIWDGKEPQITAPQVTLVNGESFTGEIQYSYKSADGIHLSYHEGLPTEAGNYVVKAEIAESGNYTAAESSNTLHLTIEKRPVTITAKDQTITYGEAIAEGAAQVTCSGLAEGNSLESVTLTQSTEQSTIEGEITVSDAVIKNSDQEDVSENYEITYESGLLTINPADQDKPVLEPVNETILGKEDGAINGLTTYMEYSIDRNTYTKITDVNMTFPVGTYYIRYAKDANHNASEAVEITIASGRLLKVTFQVDDAVYAEKEVTWNAILNDIPEIPAKTGYDQTAPYWADSDSQRIGSSIANIQEDMVITAVYTINTYAVHLPENTIGYTVSGPNEKAVYGGAYTFNYVLAEGYSETENFSISVNGTAVTPDQDGNYTITNITQDQIVTVAGVADITAPEAEITVGTDIWRTFVNTITFGKFYGETQKVTITAEDAGSKVNTIQYYLSGTQMELDAVKAVTEWKDYSESFFIDPDNSYVIYAKVTDNAGNETYISSDGLVLDQTNPVITGVENGQTYYGDVTFTAADTNLESVSVDGTTVQPENGIYTIAADNTEHTITVADKAGNSVTYTIGVYKIYTVTFVADGITIDEVSVNYGSSLEAEKFPAIPAKTGYDQTAPYWADSESQEIGDSIENIRENLTVTAVYTINTYSIYLPEAPVGYTVSGADEKVAYGGQYTFQYALSEGYSQVEGFGIFVNGEAAALEEDGSYTITNITRDQIVTVTGVEDITSPEVELTVGTDFWNTFVDSITFEKYYGEAQKVTITAEDAGSKVNTIQYYLSETPMELDAVKAITEWENYGESFSLEQDGNYMIYVKVTDNDGNTTYISSDGLVLDQTKPVVTGVEDGQTYYGDVTFTATDDNFEKLIVDGEEVQLKNGTYTITADNAEHTITVVDKVGNSITYTVEVYQIYTITFVADGKVVKEVSVNYGDSLDAKKFPAIPAKAGYTKIAPHWNVDSLTDVREDKTITAIYVKDPATDTIKNGTNNTANNNKNASAGTSSTPKTGDDTNIMLWLVAIAAAGGVIIVGLCRNKRRRVKK